jgi:hypothetical protein
MCNTIRITSISNGMIIPFMIANNNVSTKVDPYLQKLQSDWKLGLQFTVSERTGLHEQVRERTQVTRVWAPRAPPCSPLMDSSLSTFSTYSAGRQSFIGFSISKRIWR